MGAGTTVNTDISMYDTPYRADSALAGLKEDFHWRAESCIVCVKDRPAKDIILQCMTYGFDRNRNENGTFGPAWGLARSAARPGAARITDRLLTRGTAAHIKQETNTSRFGWARALPVCCALLIIGTQCYCPRIMRLDTDKIAFQIVAETSYSEEQVTHFLEAADDDTRSCQQKFLSAARQPAGFHPAQREHTYIVGKLKGAISSIDRIRVTQAECAGDRIEFQAGYARTSILTSILALRWRISAFA